MLETRPTDRLDTGTTGMRTAYDAPELRRLERTLACRLGGERLEGIMTRLGAAETWCAEPDGVQGRWRRRDGFSRANGVAVIGIRAAVSRRPLSHHRTYGSVYGGSSRLRRRFLDQ